MSAGGDPASHDDRVSRARWSESHGQIDPESSFWVSGWLSIIHRLAVPLARRHVRPDRVTAAGLFTSLSVPVVAGAGGGWPLVATLLVVTAAVLDGIDGALARMDGSESAWGRVLDPLADRCSDLAFLAALWVLGAPAALCVAAAAATLLLESVRSTAQAAGLEGIGVLTVWERPSRVIVAAFATGLCGVAWLVGGLTSLDARSADAVATVCSLIAVVLAVFSLGHLLVVLRRDLRTTTVTQDRRAD